MQTWAKRGLQTAFVTGGLLMLGTGIASADENVNPDTPASPLDLNVTVPIQEANNAVGVPFGQLDLPAGQTELSTKPATKAANEAAKQFDQASPISDSTLVGKFTPSHRNLKGNKVTGDLVVPIQIVDNAIGVIGDANVAGTDHSQTWSHDQDVKTTGRDSSLAGNAVVLDWALPVQIAGNGGGVAGGTGRVIGGSASQSTAETGDVATNGDGSSLSGNVVGGQFATPVQVTGNAASYLLGNGQSHGYSADTVAASGGSLLSSGDRASGSGNVVGAPIALPVKFNCNSGAVWGSLSDSDGCNTSADALAGAIRTVRGGSPTYLATSGNDSFLSGNAGAAALSPIANVAGVAGSWIGNASAGLPETGSSSSTVDSGGLVTTAGDNSSGSGNVLNPALALPVEAFGIGGTYIGQANAAHDNTTDANAGDGSYTRGNGAFLGGNTVNSHAAGAPEVFGIGGSHIGNATGTATEDKKVTAGGYDGTLGNDSSGSGNLVQVPVALPAEVFGIGGSFIGQGSGAADETKVLHGGGGGNTHDDNGFLSSNLGAVPLSTPVQAANIGGALIGQGHGKGSTDTTSIAGGDLKAAGPVGAAAGNIIEAPVALPVQAMGVGGALAGIGTGENDNITDAKAGGDALTNGRDGALTGNIVKAPIAGAGSVFGDGIAAAALGTGKGTNDVASEAGGDATTSGNRGSVAGNIVGVDPLAVAQVFGDAASVAGVAKGAGINMTEVENSGDDTTSGVEGAISGNILDLPVTAIAQLFGDAVTVGGVANALGENTLTTENGGKALTAGDQSSLSGINAYHAFALPVQIFGVPLELLGVATAYATDATSIDDEAVDPIAFPHEGSELAVDELPSLAALRSGLPTRGGLPTQGGLPSLDGLSGKLPVAGLVGGLPSLNGLTSAVQTSNLSTQGLPTQGLPMRALPAVAGLVGNLPAAKLPAQGVPAVAGLVGNLRNAELPTEVLPAVAGLASNLPAAKLPTQGLPALPVAAPLAVKRADVPSVTSPLSGASGLAHLPAPALPTAPALPVNGLSSLGSLGGHGTERADVPAAGLPVALPALGGVPALPKPALPSVPALPVNGLASLGTLGSHGTQRADVPATGLPVAAPALPVALPTALPTALPAVPALPVNAKLPVLDSTPQVPAMSGLDSTGFLAKLLGLVKRK
ncbi:beta strand repeat-containing protein [Amycolatopsis sp. CA-126428]|uniref:beta strand repeat-containing protein n=1 Tax=Amycolatopsis sp. CA-126428 TaxID=2073158 RepID=UPI001E5F3639|nr:PE-PGRS family protein [Amycolatopsis sp. CA-126428]